MHPCGTLEGTRRPDQLGASPGSPSRAAGCDLGYIVFFFFLKFFNVFILFLRERQNASREGAEREGDTESSRLKALSCQHRAQYELKLTDCKNMT